VELGVPSWLIDSCLAQRMIVYNAECVMHRGRDRVHYGTRMASVRVIVHYGCIAAIAN
jgi:hypothetical protein